MNKGHVLGTRLGWVQNLQERVRLEVSDSNPTFSELGLSLAKWKEVNVGEGNALAVAYRIAKLDLYLLKLAATQMCLQRVVIKPTKV